MSNQVTDKSCCYGLCSAEPVNSIQRSRALGPRDPTTCRAEESWGGARGRGRKQESEKGEINDKVRKRAQKVSDSLTLFPAGMRTSM